MVSRLSEQQVEVISEAKAFARDHFVDGESFDRTETFPEQIWRDAGEAGLLGTFIPKAYGGRELGFLAHTLVMEEFWRSDPGLGNVLLSVFGAELLMKFGSEEHKRRWLPSLAAGKTISCCAITEADAGSDIFGLSTVANHAEGGWVINGSKQFITSGTLADLTLLLAVTDAENPERTRRLTFFVCERGASGFSAVKMAGKMGIRASETAELRLSGLFVPAGNLLGRAPGSGFSQVMYLFNVNRLFACGQGVGVAQGALDLLIQEFRKRRDLASSQVAQYKLAEMASMTEAARQLYWVVGLNLDAGIVDPGRTAMAKLLAGETGVKVTRASLGLVGATSSATSRISRFYRDAKIVEIYEGAKDLEKLTIARQLLARTHS
jgi:alkylation response protein AidB-like acyl-CoA dehydrogenase